MNPIPHAIRLWQIQRTILRYHLLDIVIVDDSRFRPLAKLTQWNPWYKQKQKQLSRGERLRLAFQELGPFFIKFGQLLSTRRDILPDDIADELIKLQDKVDPFTKPDIASIISAALGKPMSTVFKEVDPIPLASASIAQVHGAVLLNGDQVVLKILRPNIKKIIDRDLALLKTFARRASCRFPHGARLLSVVKEIEQTIYSELDFLKEAANMAQSRRQLSDLSHVKIPEVIWPLTRSDFLVMERIHGIPLNDMNRLKKSGINLKQLSENISRLFFLQVFEKGVFHADMHAGNIFACEKSLVTPKIILVDFGIVGHLESNDLRYLAQNLHAFLQGDYRRIAELHVESGWVPCDTRIDHFASAIGAVCEPLLAQPLKDISFGKVMMGLLKTAAQFKAHIQPQLILLQKTLINVEGLSRQLDPNVNFFEIARISVEKWIAQHTGLRGIIKEIKKQAPQLAAHFPEFPGLIYANLQASLKAKQDKPQRTFSLFNTFWSGVGITTLMGSVVLSTLLLFANEIAAVNYISPSLGILVSASLGFFGLTTLLLSRQKPSS